MGRITDFNASGKTIAASTTVSFTPADCPGPGVVAYHVVMTGAGNTFNALSRIRVKANGVAFIDIAPDMFRAFVQRFTHGQIHYPANQAINNLSAAGTPVDWRRLTIPLCFLDREKSEEADVCQFPVASQPTVELVFNANGVAGSAFIGWTETDIGARCWPKLRGEQMNIAASQTNGRFPIVEDAVIRGFGLETTGLGRARFVLNGRQIYHAQGQPATSATVTEDVMYLETEQLFGGASYSLNAGTAAVDNSIQDPAWIKVTTGDRGTAGRSFAELGTLAAWSGAASELGIYAITPYEK